MTTDASVCRVLDRAAGSVQGAFHGSAHVKPPPPTFRGGRKRYPHFADEETEAQKEGRWPKGARSFGIEPKCKRRSLGLRSRAMSPPRTDRCPLGMTSWRLGTLAERLLKTKSPAPFPGQTLHPSGTHIRRMRVQWHLTPRGAIYPRHPGVRRLPR